MLNIIYYIIKIITILGLENDYKILRIKFIKRNIIIVILVLLLHSVEMYKRNFFCNQYDTDTIISKH